MKGTKMAKVLLRGTLRVSTVLETKADIETSEGKEEVKSHMVEILKATAAKATTDGVMVKADDYMVFAEELPTESVNSIS